MSNSKRICQLNILVVMVGPHFLENNWVIEFIELKFIFYHPRRTQRALYIVFNNPRWIWLKNKGHFKTKTRLLQNRKTLTRLWIRFKNVEVIFMYFFVQQCFDEREPTVLRFTCGKPSKKKLQRKDSQKRGLIKETACDEYKFWQEPSMGLEK